MCLLLLAPKYRNSSADLLFQKSQLLFGLDQAAAAIHSTGEALLVDGPLDVIQLHQAGFTTAVAAMGSALTIEQLQLLQRRGPGGCWWSSIEMGLGDGPQGS